MPASHFQHLHHSHWAQLPAHPLTADALRQLQSDWAQKVDECLLQHWQSFATLAQEACLCAVGGYGRTELYPHSDLDVLCLLPDTPSAVAEQEWEAFYSQCWDAGLSLASSVRSPAQCAQEASADLTVQTALLEVRYLAGRGDLLADMQARLSRQTDSAVFLRDKLAEQTRRHSKFGPGPYNLEPNCKESPGGLRDLHLLYWGMRMAALCQPQARFWQAATQAQLLDAAEAQTLAQSWAFIATVRCHLHSLAGREEDRLLFDWQIALAQALGYEHQGSAGQTEGSIYMRSASAAFMRDYYAAIKSSLQMLEMALLRLQAQLLPPSPAQPLDADFELQAGYLALRTPKTQPDWVWQAFSHYQLQPSILGFSADTLRAFYRSQAQMGSDFYASASSRQAFLRCLQAPQGITRVLRRMNACGFLAHYLPSFASTVGQVQHDLMHAYTVDQHILLVLSFVRRFFVLQFAHEVPQCQGIAAHFDRPWVLYLAALFHDIAKGQGGDHSTLGAQAAQRFAQEHALAAADAELLEFLVREHLSLSQVAQKQDLSAPEVIAAFAQKMGDLRHLQALYLLTVADIRGTNPQLWTEWKAQLLHTLYLRSAQYLQGEKIKDEASVVAQRQGQAQQELARLALPHQAQAALWRDLDAQYFLRFEAHEIAWHTRVLSKWLLQRGSAAVGSPSMAVFARRGAHQTGIELLVYALDASDLFARICAFFDRANLSVLDAKIYTTPKGWALDSFVLQSHDIPEHERELLSMIEAELLHDLQHQRPLPAAKGGRLSRRMRHFPLEPRLQWLSPLGQNTAELELSCADRLGLLYAVALAFAQAGVALQSAKIVTLGERVEDRFVISGANLGAQQTREQLGAAVLAASRV